MKKTNGWFISAVVAAACVLGFYQASAAPKEEPPQLANAIEQRMEMIRELREIHTLLAEQNGLLKEQNGLLRDIKAGRR